MLAGRHFSRDIASDLTEAFILNETAVKRFGWTDSIGKQLEWKKGFLEKNINGKYGAEERFSQISSIFSLLAIFISCLGLFGLVSFNVEQRTREIGIRKVLGASISRIVFMLTRESVKWVLVANVISWPVAYYAMNKWLQGFVYRVHLEVWLFLLGGALALVIALATVSYQAVRAATANPVDALRYE